MKIALLLAILTCGAGAPTLVMAQSDDSTSLAAPDEPFDSKGEMDRERNSQVNAAKQQQQRLLKLQREMQERQTAVHRQDAKDALTPAVAKTKPAKPRCVGACP